MTATQQLAAEYRPSQTPAQDFDALFHGEHRFHGFARVARIADPALPPEIAPFSFLSAGLARHLIDELDLRPRQRLADLGCGRGGPGLWLARTARAELVGVDFSPVAIECAREHAETTALPHPARFLVGDLTATGLDEASVAAAVSIDALQYAHDRDTAAREIRRILRPGGRLVLTGWHPRTPGDPRVPERHRYTDWPGLLHNAGFASVRCHHRPAWDTAWTRIYRIALSLGDPGEDTALAGLQDEAHRRLRTAHLLRRVAITAELP